MSLKSLRASLKSMMLSAAALAASANLYQAGCGSSLGYGSYYDPYSYYGYYDTSTVQSVIDYRLDAMDWSNNAWDEYIRE